MRFCGMCGQRQARTSGSFAAGKTLRELCEREAPIGWRRAFEILIATCHAIVAARARGAEQLSLEPESFYLERQGDRWVVTVLDADAGRDPGEPHDTEPRPAPPSWLMLDRIDYFSPEKLVGRPLDGASEVYTLGVIAFELVTGQRPFADATGPAGLITAQLKKPVPVPSKLQLAAVIPRAVDAVLLACLEKERNKRYPDVGMLAQAATDVLTIEVSNAPEPPKRQPQAARSVPPARPPMVTSRASTAAIRVLRGASCGSPSCTTRHAFNSAQDATLFGSWLLLDHFDSLVSRRPDYDPHPHAGMATLTYLFDGRLVHRDSIGTEQVIEANGLSWFHAGRGGMHSDRHHPLDRVREARLHGLELWVVLPRPNEHDPPAYAFHRPQELPSVVISGARVRVVLGEGFGARSPVVTPAPLSMFDLRLPSGAAVPLPAPRHADYQRAVYVVSGAVEIKGKLVEARHLAVIAPTESVGVTAARGAAAHVVLLGSAPVLGPRHNAGYFSASSKARVHEMTDQYNAGAFGTVLGESRARPLTPR
ncbi:MAG: pirin family protein [Myxococcales bacterium]|nr:pirin family protein [Myxococcales bacterium]